MSILSVDFGNENFLVAIPRRGGVDVINNQSSKRLSPTMVGFDNERRYAGMFAQIQQSSNPFGTIINLKRLIGVKYKDPEREIIQNLVTIPLVELVDGYIGVKLTYNSKETIFRIEQCISLLLSECFKIARLQGSFANDCVIVVSPWWGEKQRRIILDLASICGFNVLKLINSTTAAAICYSMFHRGKLPVESDKSVPIFIADIGDSSMNIAVAQL